MERLNADRGVEPFYPPLGQSIQTKEVNTMTKQQLNQRSRDMLQMLIPEIKQECKRLIASGALEPR